MVTKADLENVEYKRQREVEGLCSEIDSLKDRVEFLKGKNTAQNEALRASEDAGEKLREKNRKFRAVVDIWRQAKGFGELGDDSEGWKWIRKMDDAVDALDKLES